MDSEQGEPREASDSAPDAGSSALSPEDRSTLRDLAYESISHGLVTSRPLEVDPYRYPPSLREYGAVFVTLKLRDRLRGCVGSYLARRSLVEDVAHNAFAAAFRDSRFSPVLAQEMKELDLHISLLSPLVPLPARNREELVDALRPGVDGLLVEDLPHRSTFLPQVWTSLLDPETFLAELFLKAGLPPDHWSPTLTFHRYTVEEF
jgi:AmmeMemoRadiSam system protein A